MLFDFILTLIDLLIDSEYFEEHEVTSSDDCDLECYEIRYNVVFLPNRKTFQSKKQNNKQLRIKILSNFFNFYDLLKSCDNIEKYYNKMKKYLVEKNKIIDSIINININIDFFIEIIKEEDINEKIFDIICKNNNLG